MAKQLMFSDEARRKILEGVRGMPPADMDVLCQILIRVGEIGLENETIKEIDTVLATKEKENMQV